MDGKGPSRQLTPLPHAGKPDTVSELFRHHGLLRIETAPGIAVRQLDSPLSMDQGKAMDELKTLLKEQPENQ